jgi:hypothetical protein
MASLDLEQGQSRGQAAKVAANLPNQLISGRLERLQTPLLTVTGLATMLQRELYGPLNPKQQEYLGAVLRGGNQMLREIEHSLELRDVLNAPAAAQPVPVDPIHVLQQLLEEFADLTHQKHIRIELHRSGLQRQGLTRLDFFRCLLRLFLRTLLEVTPPHCQLQLRVALPTHQFQMSCHANQALPQLRQAWQAIQRKGQEAIRLSQEPTLTALTLLQEMLTAQQGDLTFDTPLGLGDRLLLYCRLPNLPGPLVVGNESSNVLSPVVPG